MTTITTTIEKATNAFEAKQLADNFLATLTKEQANDHLEKSVEYGITIYFHNLAYDLGCSSFYYGNTKHFCSDYILIQTINKATE